MIKKQQRQLELLQEKREQLEMMSEWKRSLSKLEDDKVDEIVKYIEIKINNEFSINENGKLNIKKYIKNRDLSVIYDAIDLSANSYLRYENDKLSKESVENFLSKIPGIIKNLLKPPVEQKIAKVLSFGRQTFTYWDRNEVYEILTYYADTLKSKGWSEDQVAKDIDIEIIKVLNKSKNYSAFICKIGDWIEDIKKWE